MTFHHYMDLLFLRLAYSFKLLLQSSLLSEIVQVLWILKQAAGHLRWKVDYPPSQLWGSGFEPHWRLING